MTCKSELRAAVKERLAALSPEDFFNAGVKAAQKIVNIPRWNEYNSVLIFISMKDEINTEPLINTILAAKKLLYVPHIIGNMLYFYPFGEEPEGILEDSHLGICMDNFPVLIITPGIAFDLSYNRLGRGKGYYDRFFAELDKLGHKYTALGLCMDCQLVDKVPAEWWDRKMDSLLVC